VKSRFNKLIGGSLALAVLLLGLIGVVINRSMTRLIQTAEQVSHTHEVLETFEAVMSDMADAETSQRGFTISGNEVFLAPYRAALTDIQTHTNQLRELVADNPGQQARLAQLNTLITTKLTGIQETIRVRRVEGFEAARTRVAGGNGQPVMDEIRRVIEEMRATELGLLRRRDQAARTSADHAFTFAWTGSGVSVVLLLFSFYRLKREIAERERAEIQIKGLNQNLQAHAAQLEAANKELEAFSYSVSHDLRAPLRHIHGFVEILQKEPGGRSAKAEGCLKFIADSARQMGNLVDDLLEFSRMGRSEIHVSQVDLPQLVLDARQQLAGACGQRDIDWRIGPLPEVRGDPAMLRLALVNLLGNAVKFTAGRARAEIAVTSREEPGEHVISVRDNGVGFDMQYVGKLFGVFQRLHHADEFEGTGIGLASVRRIIHRHGGRTWAEGTPGQGAAFYFSLPKEAPPAASKPA
jgi:signal transduction histidine kinase